MHGIVEEWFPRGCHPARRGFPSYFRLDPSTKLCPLLVTCFPQPLRPPGKHTREASQSCSPAVPISSLDLPAFFQMPAFHTLTARAHLESPAPYLRSWKGLTDCVLSQKAVRAGIPPALPAECYLSLPGCLHHTAAAGVLSTGGISACSFRRPENSFGCIFTAS